MKLIELHVLQSFPVTCLNRDDLGAPKSARFGGAVRARVSSQCWKRAIRETCAAAMPARFAGQRGHYFASRLAAAIAERGVDPESAGTLAEEIATLMGKKDAKSKEEFKTAVALYLSPDEISAIADAAAQALEENAGKKKKSALQKGALARILKAAPPKDAADISLFGRMVAADPSLNLEAAGMFSHALSTHRTDSEIDFFSAVDDLKPEDTEGAGHIGTAEYNSACYYRYIGLNLDLLADDAHLGALTGKERRAVVEAFLKACITAVPNARKNAMNGFSPPSRILGLFREGQPITLANAFEEPVKSSKGYVEKSCRAMKDHFTGLKTAFNLTADEFWFPEMDLNTFTQELARHVAE